MDVENETWKFKLMLGVLVAFIVSGVFAYMELKYSTSGKTADCTFDRLVERRARRRTVHTVYYHYRDHNGQLRNGSDDVPSHWTPPDDRKLRVRYLNNTSRLEGNRNTGALVIFFGCLAALAIAGVMFWRHVREATKPAKPYVVPKRF